MLGILVVEREGVVVTGEARVDRGLHSVHGVDVVAGVAAELLVKSLVLHGNASHGRR